jgi:hypothetical protein
MLSPMAAFDASKSSVLVDTRDTRTRRPARRVLYRHTRVHRTRGAPAIRVYPGVPFWARVSKPVL